MNNLKRILDIGDLRVFVSGNLRTTQQQIQTAGNEN